MEGFWGSKAGLALMVWLSGAIPGSAVVPGWIERLTVWVTPELRAIDGELEAIETELIGLPVPIGVNSGMSRGFETGRIREGEDLWVELTLREPSVAGMVALVPMLAKGAGGQVPGFGFPRRFQLEARDEDGEVHLLLDETGDDFPNPGLYPVLAECPPGIRLTEIRLTATEPWNRGGPQILALAEMMVLEGNRNRAQGGEVVASSSRELRPTWSRWNLIDMVTPLGLPVAPDDERPYGWQSEVSSQKAARKSVTVDLGRLVALDEIRLAPVWRPESPGLFNFGFPSQFAIEVGGKSESGDRRVVFDRTEESLQSPGQNLQCYKVAGGEVRYVTIEATRLRSRGGDHVFALAELQAYERGENVALGAKVMAKESLEDAEWGRAALTDGLVGNGRLLELSDWFRGLEQRRGLEVRQSGLVARRARLMLQGEQRLVGGSIGATCGIGVLAGWLLWRGKRQRQIDREIHRERLARDLHDELGSNLGSIALISSFAVEGESSEEQMRKDLIEIEEVARESADSMRDMVELLGGGHGGASSDWLEVMKGLAERLLRGVELDCRLPDGSLTLVPDLETRREIYLFSKEVLHNIAKHAEASSVRFYLRPQVDGLVVEIADDGCGFDPWEVKGGHGMGNLRERAAGLRGSLSLVSSPGDGTVVRLEVPRGRRWRKPAEND